MNLISKHRSALTSAIVLVAVACALGGCGRKGGLDLPPSATAAQPLTAEENNQTSPDAAAAARNDSVFDPTPGGNKMLTAPRGERKRIILDPILD